MRTLSAAVVLTACATTSAPPPRGSRGPTASEHLASADEHSERAERLARWPARERDPNAPQLDVDGATWYRTWDTVTTELRLAREHRTAAAQLVAAYDEACGGRTAAQVSTSPLVQYAVGGAPTESGVAMFLSVEAGSPDELMADLRCHRAWMRLGRSDMDSCPLDLAGIRVEARGSSNGITVEISVADPKLVPELQRRAAHDVEMAAAHRHTPAHR